MKIVFFGDIVGKTGRRALVHELPKIKKQHNPDLVIANAENIAHGAGVTERSVNELLAAGVDIFTSGNHVFDKAVEAEVVFRDHADRMVRPENFEGSYPGKGYIVTEVKGIKIAIVNFNAQVFMERQFRGAITSPFIAFDKVLQSLSDSDIIIVDFHSEATSEKRAFGFHADGRATAVIGTHTHVQTSDAQILPAGTAYISDIGMVGAADSILGVEKSLGLSRFMGDEKARLEVADSDKAEVCYGVIDIDEETFKTKSFQSFRSLVSLNERK